MFNKEKYRPTPYSTNVRAYPLLPALPVLPIL